MKPSALSARDLRVDYDGRTAARLAALDVARGEAVALIGPNGSGKSTLLRALALIEPPTAGSVVVCGVERPTSSRALDALRRQVTLALPQPWLFAGTARANIERALAAHGIGRADRRNRASTVLAALDVTDLGERDARRLSSGESARIGLARALALETPVLLLDEPFAHLDPDVVPAALAAIRRRLDAGAAVVIAALSDTDIHGLAPRRVAPDAT